jgi:hypothetical protein
MENIVVNIANGLSGPVRAAIEDMLGRRLRDDEQISVMAFGVHAAPTGSRRAERARSLKAAMDTLAAKARPVDPQDLESAFDEAMDHVRPRRK